MAHMVQSSRLNYDKRKPTGDTVNMETDFPPSVEELVETFEDLEGWDDQCDYLIELGRELPSFDANQKTSENRVHGCLSTVWLTTSVRNDNTVEIVAVSDSLFVNGLIVILLAAYSGKTAREIIDCDIGTLFLQLGLNQHLMPARRNGLNSMVKRVRQLAVEYMAA